MLWKKWVHFLKGSTLCSMIFSSFSSFYLIQLRHPSPLDAGTITSLLLSLSFVRVLIEVLSPLYSKRQANESIKKGDRNPMPLAVLSKWSQTQQYAPWLDDLRLSFRRLRHNVFFLLFRYFVFQYFRAKEKSGWVYHNIVVVVVVHLVSKNWLCSYF